MSQDKLVRDRIPEIIRASGAVPIVRVAGLDEFRVLLRAKLVEEVSEFLASEDPVELADVLEVLLAIAAEAGLDHEQLEGLRVEKSHERGQFNNRTVWCGNALDAP